MLSASFNFWFYWYPTFWCCYDTKCRACSISKHDIRQTNTWNLWRLTAFFEDVPTFITMRYKIKHFSCIVGKVTVFYCTYAQLGYNEEVIWSPSQQSVMQKEIRVIVCQGMFSSVLKKHAEISNIHNICIYRHWFGIMLLQ